jgi:amidase
LNSFDGIIDRLDIKPTGSGPLNGLTFAVKDMFDLVGHTSGFGTPDWKKTHSPALKNAQAVQQLLDAGAYLKANACADELACSLDGINVHFGTPINPQAPDRIPGGSSSGPASVVASGEVDFALGTDTAGSVRVPASYCGIFGFRPSHDLISAEGVLPLGPSFDTVGVLARSSDLLELVSNTLLTDASGDQDESGHSFDSASFTTLILPEQFESVLDPLVAPYMMAFVEELKRKFKSVKFKNIYKLGREVYDVFTIVRAREAWLSHGEWLERVNRIWREAFDNASCLVRK